MKRVHQWMNQSFSRRIAVFFIPVILFLTLVVCAINYSIYYSSMLSEMQKNILDRVEQGNYTADLYFQDVKTSIVQLADNDNLIHMLNSYTYMSLKDRYYEQLEIDEQLMNTSLIRDHILDCIIVGVNGYQTNMPDRQKLKYDIDLLKEDWLRPYLDNTESKFYFTPSHTTDYYARGSREMNAISVVFPVENYGRRLGYIIVDMDYRRMNQIISARSDGDSIQFLMADDSGRIIFSDEGNPIKEILPKDIREKLRSTKKFMFSFEGVKYFCVHSKSEITGWDMLGIVPERVMEQPTIKILKILCFVIFPCFIFITVVLSVNISKRIKIPLGEIVEQMEKVDIEHPQQFYVNNSVGEIDHLAVKVTEMIKRINHLVEQIYLVEVRSKDAQIEALISQLNPHFLYNTLQLIKTEAVLGEPRKVVDTVNCLSRFLRYTINNQEYYVPLYRELDHIVCYMEIYKKRFPDKYELEIDIDEESGKWIVPKLLLQPFVENSIKHGLRLKEGKGIIRIYRAGVLDAGDLLLCVEDNGVGMEQGRAEELLHRLSAKIEAGEHIGVKNVHDRIVLASGHGYGIVKIESQKDQYFKIYLNIRGEEKSGV